MRSKSGRRKHIPQRTCVACRQVRPKRELVRIVRVDTGQVVIDEQGRKNGRGAYLCAQRTCWSKALTQGKLSTALRTQLNTESMAALQDYAQTLPEHLQQ